MATLVVEVLHVGAEGLGDAQAVERQQRGQGVVSGRAESGLDQEGAELVAVETQGAGLVVDPRPTDVGCRIPLDEGLLLAVTVEAGQGGQAPGHGGAHPAGLFHPPAEQLQVGPADGEELQIGLAPDGEEPQVGGVAAPGAAAVAGQEAGNRCVRLGGGGR